MSEGEIKSRVAGGPIENEQFDKKYEMTKIPPHQR